MKIPRIEVAPRRPPGLKPMSTRQIKRKLGKNEGKSRGVVITSQQGAKLHSQPRVLKIK